MIPFVMLQFNIMQLPRLLINRVGRRKYLNRQKIFYDQNDWHD